MSNITYISINVLKIHPRNQEFFDDISGDDYERFKTSIKEDGVVTPLIVAPDMTIISGHQRTKACIDLGITKVPVIIREDLDDEDEKLKLLLATNFGRTKNDPAKQRKIMAQYVELCGMKHGDVKKARDDNRLSLEEIAKTFGISVTTLKENLFIEKNLTPELKGLLDGGRLSKTTARNVLARLSPEEQREVLEDLGVDGLTEKTQAQLKDYVSKLQAKEEENEELKKALEEEKNKPKEKEIVIEPDIASREELKIVQKDKAELLKEIENLRKQVFENQNQQPIVKQDDTKVNELEDKIKKLERDLKYKEEIIKTNEEIIKHAKSLAKTEQELQESYKEGYEKYNELISATCDYQSTGESVGRSVGAGVEAVKFIIEVEKLLKNTLAPLKYERFLRDVKCNEMVKNNVNELIGSVRQWADEIDNMVNGEDYVSDYGIINNFVDDVIIKE